VGNCPLKPCQSRDVADESKKVSGIWGARHVEMRSLQETTRTVLTIDEVKFNQLFDEKLFAPENLGNAPATKH
jgi:hypothetical protein